MPGGDSKALICPMAVQMRTKESLTLPLSEMPKDYYTASMFAVGIIQAEDLRECAQCWQDI